MRKHGDDIILTEFTNFMNKNESFTFTDCAEELFKNTTKNTIKNITDNSQEEYQMTIVFDNQCRSDKYAYQNNQLKEKNLSIVRFKIVGVDKRYLKAVFILKQNLKYHDQIMFAWDSKYAPNVKYIEVNQVIDSEFTNTQYIEVDQVVDSNLINVAFRHAVNTNFIVISRIKDLEDCDF
jgi:hypothetical protein